jgi:mannan endo-1,4-beta-mannosidase
MMFDRLVRFHRRNNLIWVFNANEVRTDTTATGERHPVGAYADFYPGADVVDVLATDVYKTGFARRDYDELLALAGDKVIALGEVGRPPAREILRQQPRWVWYMNWGDPNFWGPEGAAVRETVESPEALTLEELPWAAVKKPRIHYPVLK